MLYYSLFGSESYRHPEWEALFSGFQLQCRNGFCFRNVSDLPIYFGYISNMLSRLGQTLLGVPKL